MNQDGTTRFMDNTAILEKMMRMLALTQERELTCPEVFELIDYYAQLEQSGENVRSLLPMLDQHLRLCGDCAEEYEALKQIIAMSDASNGNL